MENMKLIIINLKVKERTNNINLTLYKKIYSTPNGIVNYWVSDNESEYRLEVIIDETDISIQPSKITKDMSILTSEIEIADQMMSELYKSRILQL